MRTKRVGIRSKRTPGTTTRDYDEVLSGVVELLEQARRAAARSVNAIITATYWEIGRRIVEHEQGGEARAGYGEQLLERLADDLTKRLGRGFSIRNLRSFRAFYLSWQIRQTLSAESEKVQILSAQFDLTAIARGFPLSWSHYVKLLAVRDAK